ncbi:hypothetical protein A2960_00990 [Candidatus Gottesmanbacteria bacterium RIFCSPLOWO2_01_FULL_39_12b]|uniref:Polysaccharide biosynthesis protein C-terminal domain-containing protein n=1 Tax=Candidatus Gottesmanbacteria bacterium RIFCSPLOWO2_01_FULL_39_12b TaxID=1798388 RepID=A0A1F6AQG1_9BACT|nr:MAG: hypothetical protein A2960_00990 [Candidatus Gottesmanbacteria bacterium RIFCSPLOWO2_01_FULL_39_12b]
MTPKKAQISLLLRFIYTHLFFSKTVRNTYFVFLGNSIAIIFAFVYSVTAWRLLSEADFGYLSALLAFLLLISDVVDIGIGSSLSHFLPPLEGKISKLFGFLKTAFLYQFIIGLLVVFIIFNFSFLLSDVIFHKNELEILLKINSIGVLGNIIFNFFIYALSARQKFVRVSILTALSGFMRLFSLALLMLISGVILINVVLIQTVSFILLAVIALCLADFKFLEASVRIVDLKKLFSFSKYIGIARGFTAIANRLDVLMLVALKSPEEAGIYAIASRVISVYPLFSGSVTTVIAPRITAIKNAMELKRYINKVILLTLGLISSIIVLIIIAFPFMTILFGQKSIPAVVVLQLLLVSMIFFVGSIPSVAVSIYYLKKPGILTLNSVIQLLIVIFCNLYFIPKYGRFGAAYSLIIAFGATFFLTSFLSLYYFRKTLSK